MARSLRQIDNLRQTPWSNHIVDVTDYINQSVKVEFYCEYYYNQTNEWYIDDLSMTSNSSSTVVFSVRSSPSWVAEIDTHSITAEIDVSNEVIETDESNQDLQESLTIKVPDYTVEHLRYDATDGDGWLYRARIRNIGSGGVYSGVSSTVEWSVDGNPVSTATINGLAAGESTDVWLNWQPADIVKVECDIHDDIIESDESNNFIDEPFEHPDLVVGDIWWSPEFPKVGESVTFYARVDNIGPGGLEQDFDVGFTVDAGERESKVFRDNAGFGQCFHLLPSTTVYKCGFRNGKSERRMDLIR